MATRTVLCVEPDEAASQVIRATLASYGFHIKNIANGDQAIEWGRSNTPALIVVSVEPRKAGYAICNKIKRSAELKDVPLILTSSEETLQTFEQHKKLKSRADEYMLKPLDASELLTKVGQLVGLGDKVPDMSAAPASELPVDTDTLDEISINENDIVEEKSSAGTMSPFASNRTVAPAPSPSPFAAGGPETDAMFDKETDAAFAALQGEPDPTGPISIDTPESAATPWATDGWTDESTRAVATPPTEFNEQMPTRPAIGMGELSFRSPETESETDVPPSPDEVHPGVVGDTHLGEVPSVMAQAKLRAEQARVADLEEEKRKLTIDLDDLRQRLAAQPMSKERDLLSLREIINRKEKDILDLRDAADAKERHILDHKDRMRESERARRDLEESMLSMEKGLMVANEKATALANDKEKSIERERVLKARLDDALTEITKTHEEVEVLKKRLTATEDRSRADLDRLRNEMDTRIAELEETQRTEVAKLNDERQAGDLARERDHQTEMARQQAAHRDEMEALQKRSAEEIATANERAVSETVRLRRDHDKALASLKEEQAVQLAAERQAHQEAIEAKERDHKGELLALRRRQEEELAEAGEKRQRELADAEAQRVAELEAAENRRRAELQQRDEGHHAVVAEMDRRNFTEKTETAERHRQEMDQANARAARAEGDLAARTEELSQAHRRVAAREVDLDGVRAELRERDVKLAQAQGRVAELESKVTDLEDQVLRAYQKLRTDDKVVDKAKRALAIALTLLDERAAGASSGSAQGSAAGTGGRASEENPT